MLIYFALTELFIKYKIKLNSYDFLLLLNSIIKACYTKGELLCYYLKNRATIDAKIRIVFRKKRIFYSFLKNFDNGIFI